MRPNKVHLKDPPSKKPFFSMKLNPRWIQQKTKHNLSAGMKLVTKGIVEFNRNVSRILVICFLITNTLMSLGTVMRLKPKKNDHFAYETISST